LDFVDHLVDWASGVPLLVLATARPELITRRPGWGGGKVNSSTLRLSPLTEEETAALVHALLGRSAIEADLQAHLLEHAGGNPLYAEEFVRMVVSRPGEVVLPETVQGIIAARLDTLPAEEKELLQDAAVVGKVFWSGSLGRASEPAAATLHSLERKGFVRRQRRSSIEDESEFAFAHALVRDVAYGQIPRAGRAAKHVAAARWIERIAGERVEDSAELLAHHYEQAVDLARSAGEGVADLETEALRFLLLATERALRLDTAKALAHFEKALALTAPGEPDRLRALLVGTRLTTWGGEIDPSRQRIVLEALDEARAQGDRLAEGEVLSALSRLAWAAGDTGQQFELIDQAVAILEQLPPGRELARALTRRASAYGLAGRTAETLRAVEIALPVVRDVGSDVDMAVLLQFGGESRVYIGEVEEGIRDIREGLRLALDSGPVGMVCAAHVNLGDMVWLREGPAQGQDLYERGIEFGERRGASLGVRWGRMQSMWTRFDLGRWDELLEIGAELIATEPDPGTQIAVLAEIYRQHVLVRRGLSDGSAYESAILPRALEIGDDQVVVPALRVAALGMLARGDPSGAVAAVEELEARMADRPGSRGWLLDECAHVCRITGATSTLERLLEGYTPYMTRDRICVRMGEAASAELRGESEAAVEGYREAAEGWAGFPHPLQHGLGLLGAGRCLLDLARSSEAAERLRSAREVFRGLGAAPSVAEADDLLERATARSG
ncbi:MAG TPA: hypothetical protein VFW51_04760, partial [Actinomycetota bacterium]|nr:hypothetical protein [Actinomycetota bacterium]